MQRRPVATVDDPVTTRIGSPVAVRRCAPLPLQVEPTLRALIHADNIEVICGYSLDLP
jgi:hypothetical protein